MNPKYNEGDVVRLHPWSDFENHNGIPAIYWNDLMKEDLKVFHIKNEQGTIYYNLERKMFAWAEEFLIQPLANFLTDGDFEI